MQFTFNCYRHWNTLMVRHTADGSGHFLHSKEGVTQGGPLAMIAYGTGVLPLIRDPQERPVGAGSKFEDAMAHFRDLQLRGPAQGYFPEPTKSILVVAERNVPRAKEYFHGIGIQVVTGSRYPGGFVGGRETEGQWVQTKVAGWAESVCTLAEVDRKHPQSAYAGL